MIRKPGFQVVKVDKDYMAVPVGKRAASFDGVVKLSESGAFLLKALETEKTPGELTDMLVAEYDVDPERAAADVEKVVSTFIEYGIVEE